MTKEPLPPSANPLAPAARILNEALGNLGFETKFADDLVRVPRITVYLPNDKAVQIGFEQGAERVDGALLHDPYRPLKIETTAEWKVGEDKWGNETLCRSFSSNSWAETDAKEAAATRALSIHPDAVRHEANVQKILNKVAGTLSRENFLGTDLDTLKNEIKHVMSGENSPSQDQDVRISVPAEEAKKHMAGLKDEFASGGDEATPPEPDSRSTRSGSLPPQPTPYH